MPFPCRHLRPASITCHLLESTMTGTRAMSGSEATRLRNVTIAASESSRPSSMLTSMICAPLSTCWRATSSASAYLPSRISFAKRADPVTFVRSPTFTKFVSGPMFAGSRPASRSIGAISGTVRGRTPCNACASAAMCAGVVPQQPPTMLSRPLPAHSAMCAAIVSGVSSYSPNALGSPAFGCALTCVSAMRESSCT